MMDIISMIIFGGVIGALARFFMKGNQNISMVATILLGIVGAIVGYYIAAAFGVESTKGIDWIRDIISVIAAMAAISIYLGIRGRAHREL